MAPKAKEKAKQQQQQPAAAAASLKAAAAPAPAIAVEDLFSTLHRHIQALEYEQAAKVADQVLTAAPGDEDALRCKVVALIKADAVDRALSAIQAASAQGLQIDLRFYKAFGDRNFLNYSVLVHLLCTDDDRHILLDILSGMPKDLRTVLSAYCLYRQNKLHEALESLEGQERNSMVLQLESQILYRLGRMDACVESYEKLQRFKIDSLDLKTNIVAALISAGRASDVQRMMDVLKVKSSSSFEMAYNTACSLIEKKQFADAEQMLLSARRIGQEMLMEEDYIDDEIENELAPIAVQLAYVQQLLGHTKEALEAYTDIINRKVADVSSIAVATNNLIAVKGTKDISDGLRKLDQLVRKDDSKQQFQLANGLDFKLSTRQKEAIYSNRVLLLLHANKLDQAQELVSVLSVMFPESVSPVLLQAAIFVRAKNIPKAEEILGHFADKFPDKSKPILLARAQIAAVAGHAKISAESLTRIPDIQHMPATVATIVSLRERCNDVDGATAVLDSAVEWWKNGMVVDNKSTLGVIMHEAASFKLNHGHEKEAAQLYEELFRSHGSVEALVGLITTAACTDPEKAEAYEKKLRPLPGMKAINVENLEKTSGANHVEGAKLGKVEVPEAVKEKIRKKKRKRKPRYPKAFDPANPGPPPDPERWLPRRERSTYRPKRKDKRHQVRGSQGAVSKEKHDTTVAANASSTSGSKPGHAGASTSKGVSQSSASNSEQTRTSAPKSRKKSRS